MADRTTLAASLSLALAALAACERPAEERNAVSLEGRSMGTSYAVTVPGPPATRTALDSAVRAALDRVDSLMSTYRPESELSRLNRHAASAPFPVSAETLAVLSAAQTVSELTGGAFDITVGPLVEAWGFGPIEPSGIPSERELAALRNRTGWEKLSLDLDSRTVRKAIPDLACDLSAIAKGYAVDRAAEALRSLGCSDYLVEVGGEVRAAGSNAEGTAWRVGIERPDATGRLVQRILRIGDAAVATSGNYRNIREEGGRRFGHVLDPRTGRPAESAVVSATVVADSAMRADALATAMLILGEERGLALAERESLAVLLIVRDSEGSLREAASSRFDTVQE